MRIEVEGLYQQFHIAFRILVPLGSRLVGEDSLRFLVILVALHHDIHLRRCIFVAVVVRNHRVESPQILFADIKPVVALLVRPLPMVIHAADILAQPMLLQHAYVLHARLASANQAHQVRACQVLYHSAIFLFAFRLEIVFIILLYNCI